MNRCLRHVTLKRVYNTFVTLLAFVFIPAIALGDNTSGELLDPFTGFDEPDVVISEPDSSSQASLLDHFSGYTKLFTVANTTHNSSGQGYRDWHGLSGLKLEGLLEANFHFADWKSFISIKGFYDLSYDINDPDEYSEAVLEDYQKELELQEAYLQGSLANDIDLKLGRQIVVWGRSDNFRVTDILNPLDNRDPGLTDIENLRLPLFMTKVDIYSGDWNLDLISVHEHRYNKNPPLGHFFNPSTEPLPSEETPSLTLKNTELGAELKGTFSGWDLSFYGAHYFNDQAIFTPTNPTKQEHQQISMLGTSTSVASGNMLFIAEFAHFRGLRFMNDYEKDYNRSDMLVGVEYSGWSDTTISLDYVRRYLHRYDTILDTSPENPRKTADEIACRINSNFIQDTLELTALLILNGESGQRGSMQRFTAKYNIADNWSVTGGLLFYQARNGPLSTVGDITRVFSELRYDF